MENKSLKDIKLSTNNSPAEQSRIFTTESKPKKPRTTINISRKGSIVKERCRQLTVIALNFFPDRRVPEEELVNLIEDYIGGNKETLRSYLGYKGHIRRGRCGDNTTVGHAHKGYLEKFGFMHRIPSRNRPFWVIHAQRVLFPNTSEVSCGVDSKEKISISSITAGKESEKTSHEVVSVNINKINNNTTEKERNFTPKIFPKISGDVELSVEELARVAAVPAEEPDRAKVDWGSSD